MCLAPNILADGTQVACRECWQCIRSRVDDYVGRCIAESKSAVAAHVVTLTYGRDDDPESMFYGEKLHPRAMVLTYSDVQKWLKLLRRHGYPCRYIVAGEYGSLKGRAHWHGVIFWQERVPYIPAFRKRIMHQRIDEETGKPVVLKNGKPAFWWPYGFCQWDKPDFGSDAELVRSLRYACKYLQKGRGEAQSHFAVSRMPPLGAAYFADLARRMALQGIAPQGEGEDGDGAFVYTFPDALTRKGERIQFRLRGRSLELFAEAWFDAWRERHWRPDWERFPMGPHQCDNLDVLAGESRHGRIRKAPASALLEKLATPRADKQAEAARRAEI